MNIQDFSSIRLPIQSMTYPQKCFRHDIHHQFHTEIKSKSALMLCTVELCHYELDLQQLGSKRLTIMKGNLQILRHILRY
jgi:hypothetical protein